MQMRQTLEAPTAPFRTDGATRATVVLARLRTCREASPCVDPDAATPNRDTRSFNATGSTRVCGTVAARIVLVTTLGPAPHVGEAGTPVDVPLQTGHVQLTSVADPATPVDDTET